MTSQRAEQTLSLMIGVAAILAAILCGSALLVAVWQVGGQIVSIGFVLAVQVAVGLLLLFVVVTMISKLIAWSMAQFADLYNKHRDLAEALKQRTPFAVVLTALIAQAMLAIADKSFKGETPITLAITLVLIMLFYVANELIARDELALRIAGFGVWLLSVLTLPFFVLAHRDFDWHEIAQEAAGVPLFYRALYALLVLVFVFTPLLFVRKKR